MEPSVKGSARNCKSRESLLTCGRAAVYVAAALLSLTGCESGSTSVSVNPTITSPGSGGAAVGGVTLTTINTLTSSQFSTSSGVAFFGANSFTVVGSCGRGVSQVRLTLSSGPQTTANCNLAGVVTIPFSVSDGQYILTLTPIGADGNPTSATPLTQTIYAKLTAPPAPVVTVVPASGNVVSPFAVPPGTITVNGTLSTTLTDYVSSIREITNTTGSMTYDLVGGTWSYVIPITQGNSINLAFRTTDFAGNTSTSTAIVLVTTNLLYVSGFTGLGLTATKTSGLSTNFTNLVTSGPLLQATGGGPPTSGSEKLYLGLPEQDLNAL